MQRRRDTRPEVRLRSELHRRGLRFRVDDAPIPGLRSRADIVFRPSRVAVFVDGCFWHSCSDHGTVPVNNSEFWSRKLAANVARDRRADTALAESGWTSVRVWEHEDPVDAADRVERLVREGLKPRPPR
jgi:DNA mismatch endonuclease (patch repair protein)